MVVVVKGCGEGEQERLCHKWIQEVSSSQRLSKKVRML